jgi:hypothetical protein
MEEYKIFALIAFLILSYWIMGYICYRIGRRIERMLSFNHQTTITNLKIENGQLHREIDNAEKRIRMMAEANEQMYEEGRKDVIKSTVKEMIVDHDRLDFEKIPEKKNLKEEKGGEEDVDSNFSSGNSIHIHLDDNPGP